VTDDAVYVGCNRFLRWWPKLLVGFGALVLYADWSHALEWAALFGFVAYVHARWLPWTFTIDAEGVALRFPFGRRLFLPRASLTMRVEIVGAVAMVAPRRRLGYLLLERIGYEPGHEQRLRGMLDRLGYDVA